MRNIIPAGQRGSINALDLAKVAAGDPTGRIAIDGKNAPTNFADQLEMYDKLGAKTPAQITEGVVNSLYKKGVAGPGQLMYDKSIDFIRSTTAGVVGVRPIDWQNRRTFQQVVDYRTHRAR